MFTTKRLESDGLWGPGGATFDTWKEAIDQCVKRALDNPGTYGVFETYSITPLFTCSYMED